MFTGIISSLGEVVEISPLYKITNAELPGIINSNIKNKVKGAKKRRYNLKDSIDSHGAALLLRIHLDSATARGLKIGDSVSINGACLTVTKLVKKIASFQLIKETANKTSLGELKAGDKVNIERSLRLGDRLEGHILLGHVDTTAIILDKIKTAGQTTIWFIIKDTSLSRFIVQKGSIAVDGISLTVVSVQNKRFSVALIPHTLLKTTLGIKGKGESVNVEIDIIGRYVASILPNH